MSKRHSEWRRQVLTAAAEVGGELLPGRTGGGHLTVRLPNGRRYTTSATPSDWRSIQNLRRDLRRKAAEQSPQQQRGNTT